MQDIAEQLSNLQTNLLQSINAEQAWHYSIIPKSVEDKSLCFYIGNNTSIPNIIEELEMLFGKKIHFEVIDEKIILKTLAKYYRKSQSQDTFSYNASDDFIIKLIYEAHNIGCSDIHFEVYDTLCRIRFRIDGKLIERYEISITDYPAIVNKIKIKANLDIAEKRLPQDGRIFIQKGASKFDIRVSVLPTLYGEKIVLRLLSKDSTDIDLRKLGLSEYQYEIYTEAIKKTHGIILISGPTGSGKTTTLYGTLKKLNNKDSNIITIEDPIEYTLDGINQVQLNEAIGLDFSSALRTFLRQDPDIIMIGEIRDTDTADMAIRAALTGHLVFSTIHTNSAWGIISRLTDMGIPPYLLANTLNCAVAQRLVRLLCNDCKEKEKFDRTKLPKNFTPNRLPDHHYVAQGCPSCYYTGYKGRTAIYEVLTIDSILANRIKSNNQDVSDIFTEENLSLSNSAFSLFYNGNTSLHEIYPILLNEF